MADARVTFTGIEELVTALRKTAVDAASNVKDATRKAGVAVQASVRAEAPVTPTVPGYRGTIRARMVENKQAVTTVMVESSSPFGFILENGAGASGPHPHFGVGLEAQQDPFEASAVDAVRRALP